MIKIMNLRDCSVGERVDRTSGSVLGNPFSEKRYGRDECIDRYRIWLWDRLQIAGSSQIVELQRLVSLYKDRKELVLLCWCAPKRCHAEVVAKAILWLLSK